MAEGGFHPMRALRRWRAARRGGGADPHDLKGVNLAYVEGLKQQMPHAEAMEHAIGGGFEAIGAIELGLVRHYGLREDGYLVDVGCGAGRLARPLATDHRGRYLGLDLVPDLVEHARGQAARPDWRFEVVDHIAIPEADGRADMVCFFSVLTHLLHEQAYWYLEEARRVLRPRGRIVFSFLEFREPAHFDIFRATVEGAKLRARNPLNVFLDRESIRLWAEHLGLELVEIRSARDVVVEAGNLGQAVCVLSKPS